MGEREKTTKLDEVMNKLGRGMEDQNPLDKIMEDEALLCQEVYAHNDNHG
jgi:hypothetical protein